MNIFEALPVDDTGDAQPPKEMVSHQMQETSRKQAAAGKEKPPPIYVTGTSVGDVHQKIIAAGVVKYTTSITRKGIQLTTLTRDFQKVAQKLHENHIQFYTFQLPERKTMKIVLSGVADCDTEELKQSLNEKEIFPADIKK